MITQSNIFCNVRNYCFLFGLLILMLLAGCGATHKAKSLYEKGQYIEACEVIVNELDSKGAYPKKEQDITTALNILHVCTLEFERLWNDAKQSTGTSFKITDYKELLRIRKLYENKFYSVKFNSFIQSYPLKAISLKIAEQYYLAAEAIRLESTIHYKSRADLYSAGLSYGKYKDIEEKANFYKKEYATRAAEEYYQQGLAAEKASSFKLASESFTKACSVHQAYGIYKDCETRAAKNDKIWRTQAAEEAYQNGLTAEQQKSYRTAYQLFQEAVNVYSPYGAYKDSQARAADNDKKWRAELAENEFNRAHSIANRGTKQSYREAATAFQAAYDHYKFYGDYRSASSYAKQYADLGNITYGISIHSGSSKYKLTFSIDNIIKNRLNAAYYRQSSSAQDLLIVIDYNFQCAENQKTSNDSQSWKDEAGNVRYYTASKLKTNNSCTINGSVSTQGAFAYHHSFTVKAESSGETITYTGDLPKQTLPSRSGTVKTLLTLQKEVEQKMQQEIQQAASAIRTRADQL